MNQVPFNDPRIGIVGAVSLQKCGLSDSEPYLSRLFDEPTCLRSESGLPAAIPWRLPFRDVELFHDDVFRREAIRAGGARLRFRTDATSLTIHGIKVGASHSKCPGDYMDLCINNTIVATVELVDRRALFTGLPIGEKTIEVWLCPAFAFAFESISLNPGATLMPLPTDRRPVWVTYGSSHTLAVRAHSPAQTWAAAVARECDWNLLCLGYGGQCIVDPMIGRMIRDTEADFISLELGANCCEGAFSPRSFPPAVIGMIMTIRDKHPHTPLVICSPIYMRRCEDTPGPTGMTTPLVRDQIHTIVETFKQRGDANIYEFNGLELFDTQYSHMQPDGSHPDGDGNLQLAENFIKQLDRNRLRDS